MRLGSETIEEEAIAFAAQIWCRPENGKREMDVEFAHSIADAVKPIMQERDNWIGTAEQYARNADYWESRLKEEE